MQPLSCALPKPLCPWCGASSSSVYQTRSGRAGYRRRRECLECGKRWPTVEVLDVEHFTREVKRLGVPLADVGLDDTPADQDRVRAYAAQWAKDVPAAVVAGVVASVGAEITTAEAYDLLDAEQRRTEG